jgi:hypothetical protein
VDGDDVRLGQLRGQRRLAAEARLVLGVARERGGQPLERDGAPARRVVRAVDLAHPAPADEVLKAVRPEFLGHVASLLFARREDGTQACREPSRADTVG